VSVYVGHVRSKLRFRFKSPELLIRTMGRQEKDTFVQCELECNCCFSMKTGISTMGVLCIISSCISFFCLAAPSPDRDWAITQRVFFALIYGAAGVCAIHSVLRNHYGAALGFLILQVVGLCLLFSAFINCIQLSKTSAWDPSDKANQNLRSGYIASLTIEVLVQLFSLFAATFCIFVTRSYLCVLPWEGRRGPVSKADHLPHMGGEGAVVSAV
jgi:hypothetical protein